MTQIFSGFLVQPSHTLAQGHAVGSAIVQGNAAPPTHDQHGTRPPARPEQELRPLVRAAGPVV